MSRINIDVKKAEDFNNNLRAFKRDYLKDIDNMRYSINKISEFWDDEQKDEFVDKLNKEMLILDDFVKNIDIIVREVEHKTKVASRRLV